jgi:pimeloyl-ACP methyl ester carboxylesterase
MPFLEAAGRRLEYETIPGPPDRPVIVFLHEGLGSIAMWRDFPARCAEQAGCAGLVYSRYGHGKSEQLLEPRKPDYMHVEALQTLPEILDRLGIENPILFGHSDGASIALIHAGGSGRAVASVIALAPHVFVEPEAVAAISETVNAWRTTAMREKLARFHDRVDSMFAGWHEIWSASEFAGWNIEEYLPAIQCPVLAIQGEQDEYGTMSQLDRIAVGARRLQQLRLDVCGHSPHRDQREQVIAATREFVKAGASPNPQTSHSL